MKCRMLGVNFEDKRGGGNLREVAAMRLFSSIVVLLFALGRKQLKLIWFIDGNNLLGHLGVPKDASKIKKSLEPVHADGVYLIFDGKKGVENKNVEVFGVLKVISLEEGKSADDYIHDEIRQILESRKIAAARHAEAVQVQVVTADRELRRRVLGIKPRIVRNVINPTTFWRRYLPRISGLKLPKKSVVDDGTTNEEDAD